MVFRTVTPIARSHGMSPTLNQSLQAKLHSFAPGLRTRGLQSIHELDLTGNFIDATVDASHRTTRETMKNIEALIDDGGDITLGHLRGVGCAATAADGHNAVAMLTRRDGETLSALLKRLDKAIGKYYDSGKTTDEINPRSR